MTIIRDRECWITADAQLWQTEDEIGLWMPDTPITSYISVCGCQILLLLVIYHL